MRVKTLILNVVFNECKMLENRYARKELNLEKICPKKSPKYFLYLKHFEQKYPFEDQGIFSQDFSRHPDISGMRTFTFPVNIFKIRRRKTHVARYYYPKSCGPALFRRMQNALVR